jgi:hypothetical protein
LRASALPLALLNSEETSIFLLFRTIRQIKHVHGCSVEIRLRASILLPNISYSTYDVVESRDKVGASEAGPRTIVEAY